MVVNKVILSAQSLKIVYHEYIREKVLSLGKVKEHTAIEDVTISISEGDKVAVIGRNGSGKSTLLKAMAGFLSPESGKIESSGRVFYLAGINPGFQNELTGRANIRLLGSAYGVNDIDLENLEKDVEEFVDLGQDLDRKVSSYSSGMRSKLGFGFITALDCDLLLMDEALGAGDREFRHKANLRLSQFIDKAGAMVIYAHSMAIARKCNKCIVMDNGNVVFNGDILEGIEFYNELTSDGSIWIEIPYTAKRFDENGLKINLKDEFGVSGEFRMMVYDKSIKEYILDLEFQSSEDIHIDSIQLPKQSNYKYKFQQYINQKWIDSSRFVNLVFDNAD